MREADVVITICETMKNGLIERGIRSDKIFVVPNSVDLGVFQPDAPNQRLKQRLGLRNENKIVGYISNLSSREGHAVLLRAIAAARQKGAKLDGTHRRVWTGNGSIEDSGRPSRDSR
jgi:glycogen synthase